MYQIPKLPLQLDVETKAVLKQLNSANKKLAELKGVALTIPNESILINTLILQEAKESSAVENIITTHDDLYKADAELKSFAVSASTKEVVQYAGALKRGFDLIRNNKILTLSISIISEGASTPLFLKSYISSVACGTSSPTLFRSSTSEKIFLGTSSSSILPLSITITLSA